MRAAIYIRVSTEEQKVNGLSIETQREALTEYAKNNHLDITGYYIDAGLTARKRLAHRKELLRLLDDAEKGAIDLIIFTKLDRWFRNIADYYKVQEKLDQYRVNWRTIYENYDTSTANGRLHINIMLSIAQDEADRTSERIKAVFENKRARGETPSNRAPLGYKIVNSKLLIDEDTRQIALAIFHNYDTHHSIMGCVRMAREKYNRTIYDYSIRRMLENRIYIGEFKGYKNFCEPLIEEALFYRIHNHRQVREFKSQLAAGRVYLFSTLVFCRECRHSMSCCFTIQQQKYGPKEFHYYRCKEAVMNHKCTHNKRINEEALEEALLSEIKAEIQKKVILVEKKARAGPSPKINIPKIKRRIGKLKDLYLEELINKEAYKLEYDTLTARLKAAEAIPQPSIDLNRYCAEMDLISIYDAMTLKERKIFWLGLIDKVVIDRENHIDFYLKN